MKQSGKAEWKWKGWVLEIKEGRVAMILEKGRPRETEMCIY